MVFNYFFWTRRVSFFGLLMAFVFVFSGCSTGEGGKPEGQKVPAVNSFSYSHNGMSSYACYTFTVRRVGQGAQIEFDMAGVKTPLLKMVEPEILDDLQKLIEENNVLAWDGFKGPNPPGVLDGSGFSLSTVFADGTKINAHGSNNFPKGYGKVAQQVKKMLEPYRRELLIREGRIEE